MAKLEELEMENERLLTYERINQLWVGNIVIVILSISFLLFIYNIWVLYI